LIPINKMLGQSSARKSFNQVQSTVCLEQWSSTGAKVPPWRRFQVLRVDFVIY